MPASALIRRARPEDRAALAALVAEADALHARLQPGYFRVVAKGPSPEEWGKRLAAADQAVFVAELADGVVVGLAHVLIYDTPAVAMMVPKRRGHIDNVIVTERMRQQGLGRQLLAYAADFARDAGARELLLTVWAGNDAGEQFYAALGFHHVSTVLGRDL